MGGPWNQWLDRIGEAAMKSCVGKLPRTVPAKTPSFELHLLAGKNFIHQALWAFVTFARHCESSGRMVLLDDGSIGPREITLLRSLAPEAIVQTTAEINALLERELPVSKFPTLRACRLRYIQLRKLTDAFCNPGRPRLLIDSDVLFFRRPDQIVAWVKNPVGALTMRDVGNAYGYSLDAMKALADASIPERVNTGILALDPASIDWAQVEFWTRTLLERYGSSYFLEQALVAMLLAKRDHTYANPNDYVVMPSFEECVHPTAAMHHYVDASRRAYLRVAWKSALKRLG